ncbi:MAG: class II fructose-bisphosphate aldolase [Thermus sp.]
MEVKEAVQRAWRSGTALLSVNVVNLETAQGVAWGAERAGRPAILMVSHNAARYGGLEELYLIGQSLRRKARVPLYLHYDYAEDLEDLERAFSLGFDSAMLELPHHPLSPEGRRLIREARRLAGERALEVELEVVEKGERRGSRLDPQELLALAREVEADWLVVDLGTVHKAEEPKPLDLGRLEALRALGRPRSSTGAPAPPWTSWPGPSPWGWPR